MVTNANRTIVASHSLEHLKIDVYSTGAIYFRWPERNRDVLQLTNAKELYETGYIQKLAELLAHEDTAHLLACFKRAILIEHNRPQTPKVKLILDAELKPEAKLIYLLSYTKLGVHFTDTQLEEIFAKRPDPREEWEDRLDPKASEESLVRLSLTPGFYTPPEKLKNFDDFKHMSLVSAFLASPTPVTYGDFMERHQSDYFIPHRALGRNPQEFARVKKEFVNDLYPAEYSRLLTYFMPNVPSELQSWARKRFDSRIETFKEAQTRGTAKLLPGNVYDWNNVLNLLTAKEANDFQLMLKVPNGIGSIYHGADEQVSALIAYYFAEGGANKLNELIHHIMKNSEYDDYYPRLSLNWSNPYAQVIKKRASIYPYVKAIADGELDTPLEWKLIAG